MIVGGREAAKVADRLKEKDVAVVLRLDFPDEPKVPTEAEYRKRDLAEREEPLKVLERAARAVEGAGRHGAGAGASAGVRFAFSSDGLTKAETFHAQVRKAIAAGLTPEAAVDALTRRAAEIAGLGDRLGTIEPGKLGHLVVLTGPYGDGTAKVRYVLIDGLKFDLEKTAAAAQAARRRRRGEEGAVRGGQARTAPGPRRAQEGEARRDPDAGRARPARPAPARPGPDATPAPAAPATPNPAAPRRPRRRRPHRPKTSGPKPFVDVASEFDESRKPKIKTGGNVLIKDATILTVTKGTIPKGSILVQNGKIAAVGADLTAPPGVDVIEAAGLVAMPGIIDTHSHIAIQGGVNEFSLVDRPRGPGQGRGHRRRPGDLPGPGGRDDHGAAPPRLGQHDRRPGRRDQAPPRPAGPRPDHRATRPRG